MTTSTTTPQAQTPLYPPYVLDPQILWVVLQPQGQDPRPPWIEIGLLGVLAAVIWAGVLGII